MPPFAGFLVKLCQQLPVQFWRDDRNNVALNQVSAQPIRIKAPVRCPAMVCLQTMKAGSRCPAETPRISASVPRKSRACSGSRRKSGRFPSASIRAGIFVVMPPQERPMAWKCVPVSGEFDPHSSALTRAVDFDDGSIRCPSGDWNIHREGTMAYSRSASAANTLNMLWNTSALTHLRNRFKTRFQLPISSGNARHCAPVRTIHNTASTTSRGSRPVCPGSDDFPRQYGATAAHWTPFRILRVKAAVFCLQP